MQSVRSALPSLILLLAALATPVSAEPESQRQAASPAISNPRIDYSGFLQTAQEVERYRKSRRVTEAAFLKMAREPGTLILDTRSAAAYAKVHVAGAVHLNFSDITKTSLARVIPKKSTRVLIYCNNNFRSQSEALVVKRAGAALNIPTFITLYEYGYRNVYELGPVIDEADSRLPLASGTPPSQTEPSQAG